MAFPQTPTAYAMASRANSIHNSAQRLLAKSGDKGFVATFRQNGARLIARIDPILAKCDDTECSATFRQNVGWVASANYPHSGEVRLHETSMLQRYLLIWLLALCGLSYNWPRIQATASWLGDPFAVTTGNVMSVLIAGVMFAVGLMLPRNEVAEMRHRWPAVIYGTAIQYTVMPLASFTIGKLLKLDAETFAGVALVGCVPGAMASNVLTLNARGHTSYSVSLTTAATLLSPLTVPLLLSWCLGSNAQTSVPWLTTSRNLLLTVVLPVVVGHLISRRCAGWERTVNRVGALAANLIILWVIATVVGNAREKFADLRTELLGALLAVNLIGYVAGYVGGWAARLPETMRRALTIEIGMQNAGLGALLATQLFGPQSAATIPPAIYTFGCMATGTLLANAWARLEPRGGSQKTVSLGAGLEPTGDSMRHG
jgi:BASS family bile acid:Na+ symporter